jgi:hypothetical protein
MRPRPIALGVPSQSGKGGRAEEHGGVGPTKSLVVSSKQNRTGHLG